jgi:hypothetical protein
MNTRLFMSGEIEGDVYDEYRVARNEVEEPINELIGPSTYGALKLWGLIPIIREEDDPGYDEVKKYRKKAQEFEFRLKIAHAAFKVAGPLGHRKLIMAALLRSIDEMRKLVPKGIDYDRLENDVRQVAAAKGWLPDAQTAEATKDAEAAPSVPEGDFGKKLYKRIDGILHYEEAWTHEGEVTRHWGKVGHKGKTARTPLEGKRPYDAVHEVLSKALARGFEEIPDEKLVGFMIQYEIDGMGTADDLDKLHALEARMNQTLGWLGLGHCDGNTIGSGTMEVFCYVVDLDVAIKCVVKDLAGTPYASYSAITKLEEDGDE